ncbi:MAG: macro domain-containing protein [Lachnospiraceae bacterium]|nr:macro domain-containing protein [Lachnospiraceae bacterium]
MPLQIVRNDLTRMCVDAIVNTANPNPICAGGTDMAVYQAAGMEQLSAARRQIGEIAPGAAALTPAFALSAKYIIHTVGPVYRDGTHRERELLTSCYENSLQLAAEHGCESVAFPLIAAGVYGYPKAEALQVATQTIRRFLDTTDMQVYLVVFDREAFELSGKLFSEVTAYIDEHYVEEKHKEEYRTERFGERIRRRLFESKSKEAEPDAVDRINAAQKMPERIWGMERFEECHENVGVPLCSAKPVGRSLADVVAQVGESFQKRLFRMIDERGMTDAEVYKRANLDRKLFSKIRCNENYHPKKSTAVALAIALRLNMDETKDLLARAELAFSPSSKFDLIVEYFILQGIYDIDTINLALFEHEQSVLGA